MRRWKSAHYTLPVNSGEEVRVAELGAAVIRDAFGAYRERFRHITREARRHFETRDWLAGQRDSARRLDLYGEAVNEALVGLRPLLQDRVHDRDAWPRLRTAYAALLWGSVDADLAETFFNSVTRRIFHTVGVDPLVEFVGATPERRAPPAPSSVTLTFQHDGPPEELVRRILEHYQFTVGYEDLAGDARRVAEALERALEGEALGSIELALPVFFRNKGAYIVGRARTTGRPGTAGREGTVGRALPFVLALSNPNGRVEVDAVVMAEEEVSIVFSFARTYFMVEMDRPRDLVLFLSSIMPRKPIAELFNAIGCDKHGKTELYRSLLDHLEMTDDRFVIAPGQRGMVMCVFTLPSFDVVFKVIRDRFDYPKLVTHAEVRQKYRLVFRHDRAGRLVDAQEFEHLEFERRRFSDDLLEELRTRCAETVTITEDRVSIRHLYTERRLVPLDLFLKSAPEEEARRAVTDYGQVLRDLAATNIFPGDMLLKNFGVSRHGRLIFYDYDELCLLTDCHFREMPPPREEADQGEQEPWFHVGEHDIFPEEFRAFLGLKGVLLEAFLAAHGELLSVAFWHRMQEKHRQGEVLDIYPYPSSRRLRHRVRRRHEEPAS